MATFPGERGRKTLGFVAVLGAAALVSSFRDRVIEKKITDLEHGSQERYTR